LVKASRFQTHQDSATATGPRSVAVGDFNGNGKLDLAVANYYGENSTFHGPGSVSILMAHDDGSFAPKSITPPAAEPSPSSPPTSMATSISISPWPTSAAAITIACCAARVRPQPRALGELAEPP